MKRLIGLLALTALASCGADGEPVRPASNMTNPNAGGTVFASLAGVEPISLPAPSGRVT